MSILKRAFVLLVLVPALAWGTTFTVNVTDPGIGGTLKLSDSISTHKMAFAQVRAISEGIALSDPPWLKLNIYNPSADSVALGDSIFAGPGRTIYATGAADLAALSDSIAATLIHPTVNSVTGSDSIDMADSITAHGTDHFSGSPSDSVAVADSPVTTVHVPTLYTASIGDTEDLADAIAARGKALPLADGLGLSDSISAANTGVRPKKRVMVIE